MKKQIRLLQTSDLHGYIYPRSYATMKPEQVGIAQLSSLIKKYRNEFTLLIDTGDTIQGSPFTYFLSKEIPVINPIAKIMNYLKYDYLTIGNHEFNYGRNYLDSYLKNVDATILNCNILKDGKPFYGIPYDFREVNGVTIGVIGVTTHYIPNWEHPSTIEDLTFVDAFEALKKTVDGIRDKVDIVIVNYHGGFERDFATGELNVEDTGENQGYKMIKDIDGIDVFLSGHQHRFLTGELFNTHYIQPGFNGSNLSLIDITYDTETRLVDVDMSLLKPSEDIDRNLLKLVDKMEEKTNKFLDTPVGHTKENLLIKDQLEARINKHPLITFINQVQLDYTKADISLCGLGNNVSGFNKDISIRDIISTYIYPNTLIVKEVTGQVLITALEKTAEFFESENGKIVVNSKFKTPKVQLYAYDMYDGIDYTISLNKPVGQRISNVMFEGKELDLNRTYTIAMNNYRASGGGDYLFYKDAVTINDTQTEILEILIDYIYREKELKINHRNNIKFIY